VEYRACEADLRLLAADKGRDKVGKVLYMSVHAGHGHATPLCRMRLHGWEKTYLALVLGNSELGLRDLARAVRASNGGRAPRSTALDLVDIAEEGVGVAEGNKDDCTSTTAPIPLMNRVTLWV
jgi:hypothetical protein